MKKLKRANSLFLQCEISSAVPKIGITNETKTQITQNFQQQKKTALNQGGRKWVSQTLIKRRPRNPNIVAVSFFMSLIFGVD